MTKSLSIEGLSAGYRLSSGDIRPVIDDIHLQISPGEIVGIVGESGCGKSTLAIASVGWLGRTGIIQGGRVRFGDTDLYGLDRQARRKLWGRDIVYLPQDAGSALHPTRRIGSLFHEVLGIHTDLNKSARRRETIAALSSVLIDKPEIAMRRYAHQFSGGQQQRIALALALVTRPSVLVLDEPTTGADAATQEEITSHLKGLLSNREAGVIYISHDIALVSSLATRLVVMYSGRIVETGPTVPVTTRPAHPYTKGLIDSIPRLESSTVTGIPGIPPGQVVPDGCAFADRCDRSTNSCTSGQLPEIELTDSRMVYCHHPYSPPHLRVLDSRPLEPAAAASYRTAQEQLVRLQVDDLTCVYKTNRGEEVEAVSAVDLQLRRGESVGVVGESGSGKSTLLAAIAGLIAPKHGSIAFEGTPLEPLARERSLTHRAGIQIVFQDPHTSLNPRQTVNQILSNALRTLRPSLPRSDYKEVIASLLSLVRLRSSMASRYPAALSGGEKQRVALARALAGSPQVLLCDEVVSALDVSVQAVVLNLLADIAKETGASIVFVSHDIAAVRVLADRLYVMKDGRIRESGAASDILHNPQDGYTRDLLSAVPRMPTRDVSLSNGARNRTGSAGG